MHTTIRPTTDRTPRHMEDWRWYFGNFLFVVPFLTLFIVFTLAPIFTAST